MDLDLSSLWSWTVPLWGLFLIVLFLGGLLTSPAVIEGVAEGVAAVTQAGGGRRSRR